MFSVTFCLKNPTRSQKCPALINTFINKYNTSTNSTWNHQFSFCFTTNQYQCYYVNVFVLSIICVNNGVLMLLDVRVCWKWGKHLTDYMCWSGGLLHSTASALITFTVDLKWKMRFYCRLSALIWSLFTSNQVNGKQSEMLCNGRANRLI